MQYTLFTGVLNDDSIERRPDYTYRLNIYHYQNEWGNSKEVLDFDTLKEALNYYELNYHDRLEAEAEYLSEQDGEEIDAESLLDGVYAAFWTEDYAAEMARRCAKSLGK